MDELQIIKAEVERLKESGCASPISVCDDLISFIESLEKEHVSDDLNDEIRKYFLSYKGYPHVMDETEREIKKAIIYFANWQKQQMMKDAVQGFVNAEYQDVVSVKSRAIAGEERKKLGLHLCARIKLIIIKEG